MAELNPVLVKELRGRMRGPRAFVLITIYLLILSAVTLLLYAALGANPGTDLNAGRRIGKALFLTIAIVIGSSRIVVNAHYLADVVASIYIAVATVVLWRRWFQRHDISVNLLAAKL